MGANTETLALQGAAGAIEAALDRAEATGQRAQGLQGGTRGTAIIAHPHPLFGGTMDNKVVQTLARAFVLAGWDAVRFNFRGVGGSAGSHDAGRGELEDFLAVVQSVAPQGPVAFAGFSFGAFVASHAIQALWQQRPIERIVLVGTAATRFAVAELPADLHDRALVVHGETDDTVPLADVMRWARPQHLPVTVIPDVGHFFHGQLPLLRGLVLRHLCAV